MADVRMTMDDLTALVRARLDSRAQQLDEDERVARAALWSGDERWEVLPGQEQPFHRPWQVVDTYDEGVVQVGPHAADDEAVSEHVAWWDPVRVLAEVEAGRMDIAAKRRILDRLAEVLATASEYFTVESCDELDAILAESVLRLLAESVGGELGATRA